MMQNHMKLFDGMVFSDEHIKVSVRDKVFIETSYHTIYGLGERYNSINHKGETILTMVEEKFCNQGEKTYFPLPFIMLDNGYGFFIDTKKVVEFACHDRITISFDDIEDTSFYIFKGDYANLIKAFLDLTGENKKAPKWVFGPWISAHRWNSQEIVDDVREKLKEMKIPVTVMVLEQWSDEATFYIFNGAKYPDKDYLDYSDFDFQQSPWPNPQKMIDGLHEDGIKLLLWQCPVVKHIPEDEPFNPRHHREWSLAKEKGLVITSKEKPYRIPNGNWFNGSMIPDYSNPATIEWWFKNRQYLLDIGVDGFKTDGGEFIHGEALNSIGETQKELKNNYSLAYAKAYSDFLGPDRVAFSRAGYLGQQQYSLQWAGDQKSTFDELNAIYRAGINASLCGIINWGFDIGGFSGELPSKELYYRSNQLALFTPIMQVHSEPVGGQFSAIDPIRKFNNERTIWNIAKDDLEFFEDIRKLYTLRMNMLPYTYSEYLKALDKKSTLMKHMNIDYKGKFQDNQFLYGQLIVFPILDEQMDSLEINLPEGKFYNIFTDEACEGTFVVPELALNDIFAYIGAGSGLVLKEKQLMVDTIDNDLHYDQLHFKLYGEAGSYRFLDDDNDFTLTWYDGQVKVEGVKTMEITWNIYI